MADPPAAPPGPPAPPRPPLPDLFALAATLRGVNAQDRWIAEWLPRTTESPDEFAESLHAHVLAWRKGLKSRFGRAYDLYHDLVVLNLESKSPALFVKDGGAGGHAFAEISYQALHNRCTALACAWKAAGAAPGQAVAVVAPAGIEQVVPLLTAIRMGLAVTPLPPYGPAFVKHRIEVLKPDWVAANERIVGALRLAQKNLLPVSGGRDTGAPNPRSQAPKEEVLRLLSPFADLSADPVAVPAAALHTSIFRDGLLMFGLGPGDVLAAPGFDPLQFSPHLLLATLAAGACWAEIDIPELLQDPKLGERAKITVIGINRVLRERLFERGHALLPNSTRAFFRSLTEELEIDRWNAFFEVLKGREIAGFSVACNASTGGVELWSQRAKLGITGMPLWVWPAPGRSFQIAESAAGGLTSLNDVGVFQPKKGKAPLDLPLPRLLLASRSEGYLFAGSIDLGRDAQVYPSDEVTKVVSQIPAIRYASVVIGPGRWMNDARVVLVIFTDDARGPDGAIAPPVGVPEITARISRELGERFLPDRVEIFPLRPRLVEGKVDHGWVRSQYLSGALTDKARSEMFILLSRIGYILAARSPDE